MPMISVIVPVYNAEQFLSCCIDSILSQTYSDFELILVDDGSPDNSYDICREYAEKDSRITVLRQGNGGQASARNHGMKIAKGEWICFVDSDDLIHPQMLQLLFQAAQEGAASVSMCQMLEAAELPEDFCETQELDYEVMTLDEPTMVKLYDLDEYPAWVACAKLIHRELIEAYPFVEGRVYEDNEAVCHWLCGMVLARMPHQLYFYRQNFDSTTKSAFSLKKLDYLWALESILRFYDSKGYSSMKVRFGNRYVDAVIHSCEGARHILKRPDVVKEINKQAHAVIRREKLGMTEDQFVRLLDVTHPKLIKYYWYWAGIRRRLHRFTKKEGTGGA